MIRLLSIVFFVFLHSILLSQPANRFGFNYFDSIPVYITGDSLTNAWAGGFNNPQFSKIDLDDDGIEDLFVLDRSTATIHTFLFVGTPGNPEYKYAPEYIKYFPKMQNWALLRDYNCDGKKDIFTYTPGGIQVYENISNDTLKFQSATNNSYLMTTHYGNYLNLYVSAVDIPSISDIDNDGDLDILCFGIAGSAVQYHKNLSVENYGTCDSLVFQVLNDCWGRFTENSNNSNINLWDTTNYPCDGTISNPEFPFHNSVDRGNRHVGSTMLAFDENGSGVMDLLIGDVDQDYITLLINSGSQVNANSGMMSYDPGFPSYDQGVVMKLFPAAFYEDIDGDGNRDLIVAPNLTPNSSTTEDSWDKNAVLYYKNVQTDNNPSFSFQTDAFLQGEMIDVGRGAYPVLFDYNNDGLNDLIIAHSATSYPDIANKKSQLALYENTGTSNAPVYEYSTLNYANIDQQGLGRDLIPTFGDLDGDGDDDMILGNAQGILYWIENTGALGGVADFQNSAQILNDKNGNPVSVNGNAFPVLVDLDRNGTLDLVIGDVYGKLHYYSNSSTPGFQISLSNNQLGNVDVSRPNESFGNAAPHFFDLNGDFHLFIGSKYGEIYYYDDIDANINGTFNKVDTNVLGISPGTRTGIWIEDINNDNYLEAIVGNYRGGLTMYSESDTINLATNDLKLKSEDVLLYPNPTQNVLTLVLPYQNDIKGSVEIYDLNGRKMFTEKIDHYKCRINTQEMEDGFYLIKIRANNQIYTKKFMVKH